ncbi:MAG TPA: glycosyl hydrolase family 18 protein [Clostridiales bacterium]|nr:glycosyl hydrolase family 18 protein [Clostridiales bacterium]
MSKNSLIIKEKPGANRELSVGKTILRTIAKTITKTIVKTAAVLCSILITTNMAMTASSSAIEPYTLLSDTSEYKFNMSYLYFGDPSTYVNSIENTRNSITEISPSYFDLNTNGTLKITSKIDKNFINEMHNRGIKVVPFLSNHWERNLGRIALNNRLVLVEQIVNAIRDYNLDGINVDLENLTEEDRDKYTDFVKLLKGKLPADKIVAVAVASNPEGFTKGWHGSYDYRALGQYSDYLMVMAYDEHYGGGPAGPVASYSFVERSVKYTLDRVSREKVVLGIPFFGRIWKQGGGLVGQGVSLTTVEDLISKYRGKTSFDIASLSPKAVITIRPEDEKPYIFGIRLDAGTYTIWYENEESIKYKLGLVNKYGLKGTGSWSLGQETSSTWDYYELWLNGHYFEDSQGHWAQKDITFVANKGWMIGDGWTSFAPNNTLTRAEAATALVRSLGLKEIVSQENEIAFNDISGHWAEKYIRIAAQNKIVFGRGDNSYGPDVEVTREEIAVMMDRILADKGFSNIQLANREQGQIASRGGSSGGSLGNSSGNSPGSSIDTAARYYQISGKTYKDVNTETCAWSYDSIIRMTQIGILTGAPDGRFLPKNIARRAEMAALLCRISGKI